jgi:hypothetical protein
MIKQANASQKEYVVKYVDGVYKFFEFASQSPYIVNSNKSAMVVSLGFRAITHIYQTNYIQTNDIDVSYYSMQKAYLYYLEYLEQVAESNMTDGLNHTDAILFIYNKALIHYASDNRNVVANSSVVNIMSSVSKLVETILWWDNENINKCKINIDVIVNLCNLSIKLTDDIICTIIEYGQRRDMDNDEYAEFLTCILKLCKDEIKQGTIKTSHQLIIDSVFNISDVEDIPNLSIKKWCKYIFFN